MIYRDFHGKKISLLGFGTMRFPTKQEGDKKVIDEALTEEMIRLAMEKGVNYFDTAYVYHDGQSERVLKKILSGFPRESYYLADKYPGHQIMKSYVPSDIFEEQLEKCGVDYFDFYLFHNVYEKSIETYNDPKWGIPEYFIEQKRLGRIRHLGFSTHGSLATIRSFLEQYREHLDFCQIQLNYLDWSLQDARAKVALLQEYKLPIFVMEPVRGGRLAKLSPEATEALAALRPDHSTASWAFRFLQGIEGVQVILSGMSDMAQVKDNLRTFETLLPTTPEENKILFEIAEEMKQSLPCTACRYCKSSCPKGLDIPLFITIYNEMRVVPSFNAAMRIEGMEEEKKPTACISCGSCVKMCPQNIDVPNALKKLVDLLGTVPSWAEISRRRVAAAEEARKQNKKQ